MKRKALDNFLTVCEASPIKKTKNNNTNLRLGAQFKSNKEMLYCKSPGQGHHLLNALVRTDNPKECGLLAEVTEAYKLRCSWGTHLQILSLVADKETYEQL